MTITGLGFVVMLIGLLLLARGGLLAMLAFVLGCTLMSGSAALFLWALGGASVQPGHLALGFLAAKVMMGKRWTALGESVAEHAALIAFGLYGVVAAMIFPRLFAGAIEVTPMKASGLRDLFDVYPLKFTNQNITAAAYMTGSVCAGVFAFVAARAPGAAKAVALIAVCVVWTHVALGLGQLAAAGTPAAAFFDFFRNALYAQLDHNYRGFVRITGIMPEASTYAGFGFTWFVFVMELWLRDVRPKLTGPAAGVMAAVLIFSTSSTAYVGLGVYAVVLTLRAVLFPQTVRVRKAMVIAAGGLAVAIVAVGAMLARPQTIAALQDMWAHMTVDKLDSDSGRQRTFWARQGLHAFTASWGLGVGPGSFRSSSNITAILGAMGVFGITAYAAHLIRVLKPLRVSTYARPATERDGVGVAASWTAILSLIPASVGAPTADPGVTFCVIAGMALALRRPVQAAVPRAKAMWAPPSLPGASMPAPSPT